MIIITGYHYQYQYYHCYYFYFYFYFIIIIDTICNTKIVPIMHTIYTVLILPIPVPVLSIGTCTPYTSSLPTHQIFDKMLHQLVILTMMSAFAYMGFRYESVTPQFIVEIHFVLSICCFVHILNRINDAHL